MTTVLGWRVWARGERGLYSIVTEAYWKPNKLMHARCSLYETSFWSNQHLCKKLSSHPHCGIFAFTRFSPTSIYMGIPQKPLLGIVELSEIVEGDTYSVLSIIRGKSGRVHALYTDDLYLCDEYQAFQITDKTVDNFKKEVKISQKYGREHEDFSEVRKESGYEKAFKWFNSL